ncbi:hypothetical protein [Rossellomorea sp. NS-SX7]|uniref:hypothetical protein n=1 Tax=Rossellomorea sp. NS-SX7 TaxID=3463856 RepID=UPI0040583E44
MSLKAIEMQIALPRTFDASKKAEQHNVHNLVSQSAAGLEMEKELKKKRQTATGIDQKGKAGLHRDKDKGDEPYQDNRQRDSISDEKKSDPHPYKGRKIDYSG